MLPDLLLTDRRSGYTPGGFNGAVQPGGQKRLAGCSGLRESARKAQPRAGASCEQAAFPAAYREHAINDHYSILSQKVVVKRFLRELGDILPWLPVCVQAGVWKYAQYLEFRISVFR